MARKFRKVNYKKSYDQMVTIRKALPPDHLARFIACMMTLLDLSAIYAHYAPVGDEAYAPTELLRLLLYRYVTGVFSSRKIEQTMYVSHPFRFLSSGWHACPDRAF